MKYKKTTGTFDCFLRIGNITFGVEFEESSKGKVSQCVLRNYDENYDRFLYMRGLSCIEYVEKYIKKNLHLFKRSKTNCLYILQW